MSIGFNEMQLSASMREALHRLNLKCPTPIQEKTIPLFLSGKNVVGQAQTGSGKTLAFAIPIVERINPSIRNAQALVLVPTRELAAQVTQVFASICANRKNVRAAAIYGGASKWHQSRLLEAGAQILVATPGRLLDFTREGKIRLPEIHTVILDEADRMFDMGFINDVKSIFARIPRNAHVGLFSATIPAAVREIIQSYVSEPVYIRLEKLTQDKPKINAKFYSVEIHQKLNLLLSVLNAKERSTLIFCRTRGGADKLARKLNNSGHRVGAIHGGKSQSQRERVIESFKGGTLGVLVATDLASRGLDIDDISCVVNYDVPREPEDYVHRIGRTARAGKTGSAITMVTDMEREHLHKIERLLGTRVHFDGAAGAIPPASQRISPPPGGRPRFQRF